jgi:hypothetical protein
MGHGRNKGKDVQLIVEQQEKGNGWILNEGDRV